MKEKQTAHRLTFLSLFGLTRTIASVFTGIVAVLLVPDVALAQASASSYTSGYRYDAAARLVGTISPDPDGAGPLRFAATRSTYDSRGLLQSVEQGELRTWQSEAVAPIDWVGFSVKQSQSYTYDSKGRKLSEATHEVTNGVLTTRAMTHLSYDAFSRLKCTAQRMNPGAFSTVVDACTQGEEGVDGPDRIVRNTYNIRHQIKKIERGVGTTLRQDYATYTLDGAGRPLTIVDANSNKTTLTYDGFGRRKFIYFPSATAVGQSNASDFEEFQEYNNLDQVKKLRLRDGQIINFEYDLLGQLTRKDVPAPLQDVFYGYDLRGMQLYARFGSASGQGVTNLFDGFGRRKSQTTNLNGISREVSYRYNRNGARTRMTWPGPSTDFVEYKLDGLDRVDAAALNNVFSPENLVVDYSYGELGLRSAMSRGNATMTSFSYDGISRLDSITQNFSGTAQDVQLKFSYNSASQIAGRIMTNVSYSWSAPIANRGYAVNGLNQYTSVGGSAPYIYDARGNLTFDGTRTFAFDAENRLTEVRIGGSVVMSLSYDPLGRIYQSIADGATTTFVYDGDALVGEYAGNSTAALRRYAHGAGIDEPLIWYEGADFSQPRRLAANHQGSIVAVSDSVGAATIYAYGPHGEPAGDSWSGSRFRYTGQIALPAAKLYHYKARVYDPYLGRFLQTDPVGYDDDVNLYAYVRNDPVNNADPSGKFLPLVAAFFRCSACVGAVVGAVIEGYRQVRAGEFNGRRLAGAAAGGAILGYGAARGAAILAEPLVAAGATGAAVTTVEAAGVAAGAAIATPVAAVTDSVVSGTPMPTAGEINVQTVAAVIGGVVGTKAGARTDRIIGTRVGETTANAARTVVEEVSGTATENLVTREPTSTSAPAPNNTPPPQPKCRTAPGGCPHR